MSKAHRTVSLTSSTLLAGILPLDLRAKERRELYEIKRGKHLPQLPGRDLEKDVSPFTLEHPALRQLISFTNIGDQEEDMSEEDRGAVAVFTDGSKLEGKVGAAVSFWIEKREVRHSLLPLASYCSVFQAELCAILGAIQIMTKDKRFKRAKLYSDSKSALETIADSSALHPIVAQIHKSIKTLRASGGEVALYWIRAHVGIPGNERADELAKQTALKCKKRPVYDCFPISYAKRLLRDHTIKKWQKRYSEASTGAATKMFFPKVQEAYRILGTIKMNNTLAQMFTGHGGFREYLYKFKLAPSPTCICDDESSETIEHVLTQCPRFGINRLDCSHKLDVDVTADNICSIMRNDSSRAIFMDYATTVVLTTARMNGSKV